MVTVLMPGQSDETACVRISAALSEVTKQKLGFSVSIEQVAPTNYSAELWKRMVCQTMPDLFFLTENQPLDVYLNQNCILPLSALLEERPGLKALFSEQQWASRTYYRRIYAIPARAVVARQFFCETRTEFLRKNSPVLRSKSETRSLASTAPKMEGAAHVKGRVLAWGGAAFAAPPLAFCPWGSSYPSVASPASSAASWAATGSVYSDQP